MKMKLFAGFAVGFFLVGIAGVVQAAIINISAYEYPEGANPIVESVWFEAGTYDVEAIGTSDDGLYNAWNAWGDEAGCDGEGENCSRGWINNYIYSSAEIAEFLYSDGIRYATDLLALDNAVDSSFTLTYGQVVSFWIGDYPYADNLGGMSLSVTGVNPVPEPATMLLFGTGLVGLVGSRLRKMKK